MERRGAPVAGPIICSFGVTFPLHSSLVGEYGPRRLPLLQSSNNHDLFAIRNHMSILNMALLPVLSMVAHMTHSARAA